MGTGSWLALPEPHGEQRTGLPRARWPPWPMTSSGWTCREGGPTASVGTDASSSSSTGLPGGTGGAMGTGLGAGAALPAWHTVLGGCRGFGGLIQAGSKGSCPLQGSVSRCFPVTRGHLGLLPVPPFSGLAAVPAAACWMPLPNFPKICSFPFLWLEKKKSFLCCQAPTLPKGLPRAPRGAHCPPLCLSQRRDQVHELGAPQHGLLRPERALLLRR